MLRTQARERDEATGEIQMTTRRNNRRRPVQTKFIARSWTAIRPLFIKEKRGLDSLADDRSDNLTLLGAATGMGLVMAGIMAVLAPVGILMGTLSPIEAAVLVPALAVTLPPLYLVMMLLLALVTPLVAVAAALPWMIFAVVHVVLALPIRFARAVTRRILKFTEGG